jgi:hypothetical protein
MCGNKFAATVGSAIYGAHLPGKTIESIVHHAVEGVGVRATARLLGLHKDTVNNVIFRVGLHCAKILSQTMRSLSFKEVQFDEMWTFIKKNVIRLLKKNSLTIGTTRALKKKQEEDGFGPPKMPLLVA